MKNSKNYFAFIFCILFPALQYAQNSDVKIKEIGLNAISILRGGNNAGFIYKIHNPVKKTATRLGFSGFSNNTAGSLFSGNYDNKPPAGISDFTSSSNSFGISFGKEFHFYEKSGFRVYSFNDIGLSFSFGKSVNIANFKTSLNSSGQRHILNFDRETHRTRSISISDNPGIGMRYEWKQFALFLETNIGVASTGSVHNVTSTSYYYDAALGLYKNQWTSNYEIPASSAFNFSFNPVTILYFSYSW